MLCKAESNDISTSAPCLLDGHKDLLNVIHKTKMKIVEMFADDNIKKTTKKEKRKKLSWLFHRHNFYWCNSCALQTRKWLWLRMSRMDVVRSASNKFILELSNKYRFTFMLPSDFFVHFSLVYRSFYWHLKIEFSLFFLFVIRWNHCQMVSFIVIIKFKELVQLIWAFRRYFFFIFCLLS